MRIKIIVSKILISDKIQEKAERCENNPHENN